MPTYEYRCRACGESFELRRSMAESDDPAACSSGHTDTTRLLSVFASVGSASAGSSSAPADAGGPPAAGCGGGCGCYPG